ncbi:MAG: MFS transporter [Candidatus Korobacteraceae bacterium]
MEKDKAKPASGISRAGLNAANFFQAEAVGVVMPVLNAYLRASGWKFDSIGVATAVGGLGALLFQTPAGLLTDRINSRRALFAISCLIVGGCFVLLPVAVHSFPGILSLLFAAGATGSFLAPVLGALALSLVGHARLNRTIGDNQSWNHAGNIAAAVLGIAVVAEFGLSGVFYSVALGSVLAAVSVLLIQPGELNPYLATGRTDDRPDGVPAMSLLRQRSVATLFVAVALFHFANAPILPAVALDVQRLGGSNKLMTATVLTAQLVMVPVSLLAGRLSNTWGRKPVMAVAFWVLPLRILSYAFVHSPATLVALQALDGIGAGIYGVAIVAMAADLTRGKGGFNTLMGLFATALAVGGVVGPLLTGVLIQHLGFATMFFLFAALALAGALWFQFMVRETSSSDERASELLAA